jgi:hypothetical protein
MVAWFVRIVRGANVWFVVCMGGGKKGLWWCVKQQMGDGNYEV